MRTRLYRRGRSWWVEIRTQGERIRKSLGATDRALAIARLRAIELDLAAGRDPFARHGSFAEYAEGWLERVKRRVRRGTFGNYRRAVREASRLIGAKRIDQVTRIDARNVVEAFRIGPDRKPRARATIMNLVVPLQALFGDALEAKLIRENPFARSGKLLASVGLPPRRESVSEERAPRPYTVAERARLLEALATEALPMRVAVLLGLRAGLRRSEILGLERGDVDFAEGGLHVRRRFSRGEIGEPKSRRSRRRVPLSPELAQALHAIMAWNDRETLRLRRPPSPLLFPALRRIKGAEHLDERRFGERFDRFVARAGVAPRYHGFHALRHTYATDLLLAGVPILTVSRWLGHQTVGMTTDTYGHLLPEIDEQAIVDRLDTIGHESGTLAPQRRPVTAPPRRKRASDSAGWSGGGGWTRTSDTRLMKPLL